MNTSERISLCPVSSMANLALTEEDPARHKPRLLTVKDLYAYDDGKLNVHEDFVIHKGAEHDRTVEVYLHGDCHLMALALSKVSGIPLGVMIEEDAFWTDDGVPMNALNHAYCILERDEGESLVLDARGFRLRSETREEYAFESDCTELQGSLAESILHDWINAGLLRGFEPGEEQALIGYAESLKALGVMSPELMSEEAIERLESANGEATANSKLEERSFPL